MGAAAPLLTSSCALPPPYARTWARICRHQLRGREAHLLSLVDALAARYHSGFARSIQNYSQILQLFGDATGQVQGLKRSLADATRQLAVQSRHLHQQVSACGSHPVEGGAHVAAGAKTQLCLPQRRGRARLVQLPAGQERASQSDATGQPARLKSSHGARWTPAHQPQWRKSMMLEAQTKLLADVQLVVDAPGKIQDALNTQVLAAEAAAGARGCRQ